MKNLYFLICLILLAGCEKPDTNNYSIIISEIPANLGDMNSIHDDYNSDLPYPHSRMDIYFSSNRKSQGGDFDFINWKLDFSYHEEEDVLNVSNPNGIDQRDSERIFPAINTAYNEFGPHTYRPGDDLLFLFSNNLNGSHQIKFIEYTNWDYSLKENILSGPFIVKAINDGGDNLYPCIDSSATQVYFCSNRDDEVFDIYLAKYPGVITRQSLTEDTGVEVNKLSELSSDFDDKCPYVKDDIMVFTSTRPGGSGGFDLWYSKYADGSWSDPLNFGASINSPGNEYRPVIFDLFDFHLMIFSSDRPGGKGGYDLYIVKISI